VIKRRIEEMELLVKLYESRNSEPSRRNSN